MKKKTALEISNEIGISFPKKLTVSDLPEVLHKNLLIEKMKERLAAFEYRNQRDFSGGVQTELGHIRELKVWIGKIERGEFNVFEKLD